ncbi:hypothetical protein Tco_0747208 [Tanacetum coccineum]
MRHPSSMVNVMQIRVALSQSALSTQGELSFALGKYNAAAPQSSKCLRVEKELDCSEKKIKTSAKGDKAAKIKQSATKSKGLTVLSEVALSEADQMKLATKRSKKIPQLSRKWLRGSDVPELDHRREEESWTFSQGEDEEENDEHDSANNNDDEDDDHENDSGETESNDDGDNFVHLNLSTYKADDQEKEREEKKANTAVNDDRDNAQKLINDVRIEEGRRIMLSVRGRQLSASSRDRTNAEYFAKLIIYSGIVENLPCVQMEDAVKWLFRLKGHSFREKLKRE